VGAEKLVGGDIYGVMRTAGPSMSPFNAWVFLKGLETLNLRLRAHSESALAIAQWLETQKGVSKVYYAGLASHPQHALAKKQQSSSGTFQGGGVLAFEVEGGKEAAWRIIDAVRVMSITANLGDTKTTITHPATTTHGRVTPEARAAAGITDGLIRVSVGLEDVEDLKRDLARGLVAM
jgi:O-succinylhomoserine sulfhydrylase